MKTQRTLPFLLLSLLAAPLLVAQQPPAGITGRPLYGAAPQAQAAPTPVPASDARVLDIAERLKTTVGQVRAANPAVLPAAVTKSSSAAKLQRRASGNIRIRMRPNTGTPRFIEGAGLERAALTPSGGTDEQGVSTARNFLRENKELMRLNDPDLELVLQKSERDDSARRHLRFEQRHKNLRVYPGEVGIHLDSAGDVYLMTGAYVPTPEIVPTKATITGDDAIARARIRIAPPVEATATDPELIVYAPGEKTPRLAWQLDLIWNGGHWMVAVDATNGRILATISRIASANVAGSGTDLFGQTRPLNVWAEGGTHFLVDTSKQMFDPTSDPPAVGTTRGGIVIVDARNQPPTDNPQQDPPVFNVVSTSPTGFNIRDTVSAAFNISRVYDYYLARHNRNSYDGDGGTIYVIARLGVNYFNATFQFQGGVMRIGDADTFAGTLDVMSHEVTHGVTGSTSNLEYQFQSGALNEAFSDIFGEMAEFFHFGSNDWLCGTSMQAPLRNMKDPNSIRNQPAKMSQFQNLGPDQDAGGVHINSGIINHCYYLLTEGLQGGIGRVDAEKIFYRTLTVYLMKNSSFIDARLAAIRSAKDLFGENSVQAQRTALAFDGVEIFDTQPTPPPPDTPEVGAADSTLFIYGNGNTGFGLARREAALNDPIDGTFLGLNAANPRPPAANGAGNLAVYVTADNDIALLRTDGQGEEKLGFPGLVNSVSMSPDGSHFGFVLRTNGQPDNFISVIDVVTPNAQPVTFELKAPATDGAPIATISFADAMAFTANGRFLIYDALNAIKAPNGTQISIFSIYALDLASGNILSLVGPLEGFNIGNPSISKTSDNFMAFEAIRISDGVSFILTSNLNDGTITQVGESATTGYPSYTGGDEGIVYAEANPNGAPGTGISLVRQALTADRQTASGNRTVWLQDGGFPFIYRRGAYKPPPPTPPQTRLANISTRMRVLTGERVLIAGFIITGNEQKKVIIRGIGPSLSGVGTTIANPTLRLSQGSTTLATNDNWKENQAAVQETTIPPTNDLESAIVRTLNPGAYTAILQDKNGASGIGVVEVYDLSSGVPAKLANISTRGFVDTGDNIMIGGVIVVQGTDAGTARVIIRALGPSLTAAGVTGAMQDPTLQLVNGNGAVTASNNNWKQTQRAEIEATTIPPKNDRESAIVATLVPGNYTAVVRGNNNSRGVALVEVYNIQ